MGKYLLGMRFPERLVNPIGDNYGFALPLAQFKDQIESIVKVENNDEASIPACEHGCP